MSKYGNTYGFEDMEKDELLIELYCMGVEGRVSLLQEQELIYNIERKLGIAEGRLYNKFKSKQKERGYE